MRATGRRGGDHAKAQPSNSAVVDAEAHITIAAVVAWPGLSVDKRECRQIVTASFGDAIAASLRVLPIGRVPLTEQGKPDRAAIKRLASRLPLAA